MKTHHFNGLINFAIFLGYHFPEEIFEVAWYEGFYRKDEFTGDYFFSIAGINDFLNRLTHGKVICTALWGDRHSDNKDIIIEIEEHI